MDKFYWSLVHCRTFDFEAISESWLAEQCGLYIIYGYKGGINKC